jgi:glutamyl-tRNA reductase
VSANQIFLRYKANRPRSVLLLGAGFVTRPTAEILGKSGVKVVVACRTLEKAQALAKGVSNSSAISVRKFHRVLYLQN